MISILMPIYNGIEFIEESVNSIKKQTYANWELIIGINGYPPNSDVYNTAKKYESDKIKVLDMIMSKGKSQTLNDMIMYSSYNWISLLDVDDIWHPNKLQTQIPYMNKYDVIGTQCQYFGDRTDVPYIPLGDISTFDFKRVNPIINSSCLVRKELCLWNTDNNVNGIEDYKLWLELRNKNKRFYNVNKIMVLHRIHNESAFNAKGNNKKVANLLKNF